MYSIAHKNIAPCYDCFMIVLTCMCVLPLLCLNVIQEVITHDHTDSAVLQ